MSGPNVASFVLANGIFMPLLLSVLWRIFNYMLFLDLLKSEAWENAPAECGIRFKMLSMELEISMFGLFFFDLKVKNPKYYHTYSLLSYVLTKLFIYI